jgi:glycosyltransferase involved in cell wall biosynthesis
MMETAPLGASSADAHGTANGSRRSPASGFQTDLVSVVVPTLNSSRSLADCLRSLQRQSYERVEIIVVDGNSTDGSRKIAEDLGATVLCGAYRRSTARRIGTIRAKGEYLFFIDSDQIADKGVISECVEICSDRVTSAVRVPERDLAAGYWARVRRIDWALTESDSIWYPRFFSHDVYDAIGMHSPGLEDFMEDRDLYLRLVRQGSQIGRCKSPVLNHFDGFNPLEFGIRRARAANDANEFYKRNHELNETIWSVIRPRLIRMAEGRPLLWKDVPYAFGLPAYVTVVYGPRFARVLAGLLGARLPNSHDRSHSRFS